MGRVFCFAQRAVFSVCTLLLVTGAVRAQETPANLVPPAKRTGFIEDWSTRHVIYTRNGSVRDMMALRDDPRFANSYFLHYMREHGNSAGFNQFGLNPSASNKSGFYENSSDTNQDGAATDLDQRFGLGFPIHSPNPIAPPKKKNKVDWSISLGPTAGMAFGETPSVFTYNYSTPSCSNLSATPPTIGDFAVYTINVAPTVGGQANLVGLTNLYTTGAGTGFCPGTAPVFLFSYAIGTGAAPLSPVTSLDGSQIAWIENRTTTDAYLHVTVWVANQGGTALAAVAPNGTFSNGACTTAGQSCDFALEYTNATYPGCPTAFKAANGHSELYVDYPTQTGFISANNGLLYHIKNLFSTTANPSVDFCIPVNTTFETTPKAAMSGPVYDNFLKQVFITDSEKIYSYSVGTSLPIPTFTPVASFTYGNALSLYNYPTGPGPLLDMFNGYIYVFSAYDVNGNTSVTQLPTSLASGVAVKLGAKSTNSNQILFYGTFDNNYYNNGPANATSTLYSCGTDSTTTTQGLFSISFNASTGVVNTTPAMSDNKNINPGAATNGVCSPLTEFYDGTNDRLFVGMGQPGSNGGANVVTMWNINNQLTSSTATPTASATGYLGGTSGISADNSSSGTAQAESIYFSTEQIGTASTPVPATTAYNVNAIYSNGRNFSCTGGLDNDGNAYSSTLLGTSVTWNGTTFTLGTANLVDAWSNLTITLPPGQYSTLTILAAAVNVTSTGILETFTVNYTDGTSTTLSQNFSDWFNPLGFGGESIAKSMAYRNTCNGGENTGPFDVFGYSFAINPNKTVSTLTLPATRDVVFLAAALSTNCGGADYCAVKLTQTALQ
jgi:hypothetical protein